MNVSKKGGNSSQTTGRHGAPSDIQGLIYIPFKDTVPDAGLLLAKEMAAQGYNIDVSKL